MVPPYSCCCTARHGFTSSGSRSSPLLEVFLRYENYVRILKWTAVSLFAYVATALAVGVPWARVAYHTLIPNLSWNRDYLVAIVAVLGTTITS
jgi:Mn2+/Fe2+ NRAMP family transporter